jgi:hypothetical protein
LHDTVLDQCGLKQKDYTLNQIRYDLRKLRLHGIIERIPHSHAYCFTQKGYRLALLLIQLRKRIYGPVAFGILAVLIAVAAGLLVGLIFRKGGRAVIASSLGPGP